MVIFHFNKPEAAPEATYRAREDGVMPKRNPDFVWPVDGETFKVWKCKIKGVDVSLGSDTPLMVYTQAIIVDRDTIEEAAPIVSMVTALFTGEIELYKVGYYDDNILSW